MFIEIIQPNVEIYDGETNKFIGEATYVLPPESEQALLDLINNGIAPTSLLLLDENIYRPARDYIPPIPYKKYKRNGIFHAQVIDSLTGERVPVTIHMRYDAIIRGDLTENPYFYDSVEYSNILVDSIDLIY